MNILIGLAPAFLYSAMCLIMGYFKTSPRRANVGVSLSAALTTFLLVPFVGLYGGAGVWGFGIAAGLMWSIAQYFQLKAYAAWGVSRTLPLSTALQILINTLVGVVIYREWSTLAMLGLGVLSVSVIVGGVFLCNWRGTGDSQPTSLDPRAHRRGLAATATCGVLFGVYPAMLRLADVDAAQSLAPMGVGLLIGTVVLYFLLREIDSQRVFVPVTFILFSAGAIWALGNAGMLYSVGVNGVAIGFALSQLGVVLTTLGGIYLLGEKRPRAQLAATWIGVVLVALGGVGLGLVKLI